MKCPRCQMEDVYRSQRSQAGVLSLLVTTVRCHRCCYLFKVPRWSVVEEAPHAGQPVRAPQRRAA